MNDQSCGLVHNQQVVVFEDNFELDRLGHVADGGLVRDLQ